MLPRFCFLLSLVFFYVPATLTKAFPNLQASFTPSSPSALPSLPLVNTFMGIWKLVDGKNFNDYLKSLRVDFATMTNLPHH